MEIEEEYALQLKLLTEHAETLSRRYFEKIMVDYPGIQAIRWDQYTPYFNDGNPCTFRVRDPQIGLADEDGSPLRWFDEYDAEAKPYKSFFQAWDKTRDIDAFVDMLLRVFDDHTTVTVTRGPDGIHISEDVAEHD